MKIEDILDSSEKQIIKLLQNKMDQTNSIEELKLYKHHVGVIIENAISREQLKFFHEN